MVRHALHTRTNCSPNLRMPEATAAFEGSLRPEDQVHLRAASPAGSFDIGSFDLVREFVEHVMAKHVLLHPGATIRPDARSIGRH